ncbi:BMP family ABC transporter substrate-binding protein [Azospirillum sp. RWY-5-1]|uniref:BMP family ABC transporter substrate-binding protein n=1 Tax=Azospirillum oleiclasticum TaxID=2735135 RepID=A0ABX2TG22_9PROT|nr:BMP family ABC transporter substrate-binding protein [Azospirillum oleiclasticum]NYZ14943.1 BMP family ABC transporter substrate-binding protein [Azospirillum oleiclasticum]NYZ22705.1 BMP family ABC transporter substrate-binding protein [Azospirillum oleiclasticum]
MMGTGCDRRAVLAGLGAAAFVTTAGAPVGFARAAAAGSGDLRVGVVYAGSRDDGGYNQSHALAIRSIAALPGVQVLEREAEGGGFDAVAGRLAAKDECRIVFVTAPDLSMPALLAGAMETPDTLFVLFGGVSMGDRLPANVALCSAFIDEAQHVAGLVAGYVSRSKRLGFVGAGRGPGVLRSLNALALGARRADPGATLRVAFLEPGAGEAEAADAGRALLAAGADTLAGHLPTVRPLCVVAEEAGAFCCGLHTDLSALAPTGYLTGAEWDWARADMMFVQALRGGNPWPRTLRGGLGAGLVRCGSFGPAVSAEARAHAEAARFQLANGNAAVFRGPILDNAGRVVVPKGKVLATDDPALGALTWLAEGVSELAR